MHNTNNQLTKTSHTINMSILCTLNLTILSTLSLISLLPLSFSQTTCKSLTFSNKKTFNNCIDLPTLKATLHWTYNPTNPNPTFSMAFTATPPIPDGWVAWALNPRGSGMVGAQAIIAYKPNSNNPMAVSTYDLKSYHDITMGPISYNVTGISAEESNGKITVFATWSLRGGASEINHVWQVGNVLGGKPGMHEFQHDNLGSKMVLHLVNGPLNEPDSKLRSGPISGPSSGPTKASASAPASNGPREAPVEFEEFWFVVGVLLVYLLA